jgi:hypothetical protein
MKKTHPKSTFEIWRSEYINCIDTREEQDKEKIILQIEPSYNGNNYMVEIINKEDIIID